jgi:hypothetical protein
MDLPQSILTMGCSITSVWMAGTQQIKGEEIILESRILAGCGRGGAMSPSTLSTRLGSTRRCRN